MLLVVKPWGNTMFEHPLVSRTSTAHVIILLELKVLYSADPKCTKIHTFPSWIYKYVYRQGENTILGTAIQCLDPGLNYKAAADSETAGFTSACYSLYKLRVMNACCYQCASVLFFANKLAQVLSLYVKWSSLNTTGSENVVFVTTVACRFAIE